MNSSYIRTETIRQEEAWGGAPNAQITNSFKAGYSPSRIFGPARFLRLLYGGGMGAEGFKLNPSNVYGCYWFAEDDVLQIKARLAEDLNKEPASRDTYLNRMAFALRNELRQGLAVCRDWSPRFDTFARLTLPAQKSVVGLTGVAKGQHVYSSEFPGQAVAIAPDTELSGGLRQYVIRFDLPANAAAIGWIHDGLRFDGLCR